MVLRPRTTSGKPSASRSASAIVLGALESLRQGDGAGMVGAKPPWPSAVSVQMPSCPLLPDEPGDDGHHHVGNAVLVDVRE